MDAENQVRKEAEIRYQNHEITLKDIWNHIEYVTGIDAQIGMRIEIETELELCFANPYMKRCYRLLKSQGKKLSQFQICISLKLS